MTDGQLLECFLTRRDEAAFEALVRRHGPMVLGVCRRVLRNHHDAEDAFQATFLVLARKAASIGQRELVGNWLYGAAYRAALEAKAARRRIRERQVSSMPEPEAVAEAPDGSDLRPVLDQELSRLPDKYRVPVVLCDLQGRTRGDVARQLGIPAGTLSGRLTTARRLLARRLARHGFTVAGGALAAALSPGVAAACVPAPLVLTTVKAATLSAGQTAGLISAQVVALTEGVLKTMLRTKLKSAMAVFLTVGILASGVATLVLAAQATGRAEHGRVVRRGPPVEKAEEPQAAPGWRQRLAIPAPESEKQTFAVAISPDGKGLAVGYEQGAKVLDAAAGRELTALPSRACLALAFSPDGKRVAQGHMLEGHPITLADASSGQALAELTGATKNVCSLAFAPDGKTLASAGDTVRLWDLTTNKELREFKSEGPREHGVYSIAFSPDGKKLASAEGSDRTVKVWEVATGKELATFKGHTQYAIAVAFSPDGKTVASGGGEGNVKLWDLATGKERATLKGTTAGFHSLAFSPDGKTLASAGYGKDQTVRLWDVASGKEIAALKGHTGMLRSLAFSRDGKTLVTAGDDAVRIWEVDKK
jgi:RNA polymerase sigma factor (sigma-70 family)